MSYDVYLEVDVGGKEPFTIFDWNYTSNCAPIWRKAGCDIAEFDGKKAYELNVALSAAIYELTAHPDRYRELEPENGWGSLRTLVPSLRKLREKCVEAPLATVRVSR